MTVLRKQFRQPRAAVDDRDDLVRELADYDRTFGLIEGPEVS